MFSAAALGVFGTQTATHENQLSGIPREKKLKAVINICCFLLADFNYD